MIFINGQALIESINEWGIIEQQNFYTNPINITLKSALKPLSGSLQCISRPAMDEAEIYGIGLERGRAMNFYINPNLNQPLLIKTTTNSVVLSTKKQQQNKFQELNIKTEVDEKEQVNYFLIRFDILCLRAL